MKRLGKLTAWMDRLERLPDRQLAILALGFIAIGAIAFVIAILFTPAR